MKADSKTNPPRTQDEQRNHHPSPQSFVGDIGRVDQLTSAREENVVLRAKVEELTMRIRDLTVENEALRAEAEMYREDYRGGGGGGSSSSSSSAAADNDDDDDDDDDEAKAEEGGGYDDEDFITSGNGMYPADPAVTLPDVHGTSNPLCCALNHPDDTLLATGGSDSHLSLCRWGNALSPGSNSSINAVRDSIRVYCRAPIICCAFARVNQGGREMPVIAAGCMDGSVMAVYCGMMMESEDVDDTSADVVRGEDHRVLKSRGGEFGEKKDGSIKHSRYVKTICWSPTEPVLASASADGTVQLTRVLDVDVKSMTAAFEIVKSMHFDGPVESMCYLNDGTTLCCYVRGTSYLTYFDLGDNYRQIKVSLNGGCVGTGGFDDHVSFAVLSIAPSPRGTYIALATDASRNIIMEAKTGRIIRNLYGHKNDVYGNPKIAWSKNGKYLYGNSQDENCICVWDVASASIVRRLDDGCRGHAGFVRDIYSSGNTDTLASVSFDKTAKIWLM
ncbi:hypothetical protein ACHAXA_004096 [Cyclostephanos tholiformis]|uniref:Uncharacterized protein n=1 Tax=Cyclostephanos tholiformis TaxID=382380 RepID=A0ABD3SGX0_9STRA